MKQSLKFIILAIGIGIFINQVESFHLIIPRPELGVIDIHPFYYNDEYLLNNTSNEFINNLNEDKHFFSNKNFRSNIFGICILFTLIANHLNLIPN